MDAKDDLSSNIRREARVVGLRGFNTPSLESVERRRLQLWVLSAVLLVSVSLGVVVLSVWPVTQAAGAHLGALRFVRERAKGRGAALHIARAGTVRKGVRKAVVRHG